MKILMIYPPYRHGRMTMPLGMAYIASVLLKEGHDVTVIDADAYLYTKNDIKKILKETDYQILATGGMSTSWNFIKFLCEESVEIKPKSIVVVGGLIVTTNPSLFIQNNPAHFGVIGEGENTMKELVSAIENRSDFKNIDGIIFRENEKVIINKPRELIKNLDSLPLPAWEKFNVRDIYSKFSLHRSIFKAKPSMSISTGRGCPYSCTFCSYNRAVRLRSAANIVAEIQELISRYHVRSICILDELFIIDRSRAIEFCEILLKKNIKIAWMAAARVNLVDRELLKIFKSAGCFRLAYGIESGSQAMLDRMKKGITIKQIKEAIKNTVEAGIDAGSSWILGMPGESRETIRETISLYKELNNYRNYMNPFFFAMPLPGTELYEEVKGMGRIKNEVEYLSKISEVGEATSFIVNCTTEFSDSEMLNLRDEVEAELLKDLKRKHRIVSFFRCITEKMKLFRINALLIFLKLNGFKKTVKKICQRSHNI